MKGETTRVVFLRIRSQGPGVTNRRLRDFDTYSWNSKHVNTKSRSVISLDTVGFPTLGGEITNVQPNKFCTV